MAFKRKLFDTEDDLDTDMPDKSLTAIRNPNHVVPTYWLFFARENGNLYIYSIPEFQLVYMVKKFNQLHEVLYDDASSAFDDDERYMNIPMVAIAQTSDSKSSDSIMIKPEEVSLFEKNKIERGLKSFNIFGYNGALGCWSRHKSSTTRSLGTS